VTLVALTVVALYVLTAIDMLLAQENRTRYKARLAELPPMNLPHVSFKILQP